ncbi:MAG: response regulator transcription factor [Candidatus Acidiferrales bacterium]
MPYRVLIADPHQVMRSRVRTLFENAGWQVVGEAANGKECVEQVEALAPDLVVLELSMPLKNGVEAAAEIRDIRPSTKLLMFTIHDSEAVHEQILRAGVDAVVVKPSSGAALLSAAAKVMGPQS